MEGKPARDERDRERERDKEMVSLKSETFE
jgi:hypothetical protein